MKKSPDDIWMNTKFGHPDSERRYTMCRAYQQLSLIEREKWMKRSFPLYDELDIRIPMKPDVNYKMPNPHEVRDKERKNKLMRRDRYRYIEEIMVYIKPYAIKTDWELEYQVIFQRSAQR